ncbi:hypothetical protein ACEPPN_000944 [Leptodophora sp. 'Broadleaf-Isolate-01']
MSPITTPASWSSTQNSPQSSGYLSHGTDGFDNLVFNPSPHIVSPQQTVFHSYFALDSNNLETPPTTDIEDKHPHINISESPSLEKKPTTIPLRRLRMHKTLQKKARAESPYQSPFGH